jgi:hypothetical protein
MAVVAVVPVNQGGRYQTSTGTSLFPITPSDTIPVGLVSQLIVTVAGNIAFQMWDGSTPTLAVALGQTLKLSPKLIKATGTTATVFGSN